MKSLPGGAVIGDFRIEGVVGRGGMGVVYRAVQISLGRPVALKLIAPTLAEEAGFRERFERESRIAASLDHPHVVPVFAAGEHDGTLYIAMRFVEGPNLGELIRLGGPLRPARAARIIAQVASALDEAHRAGLVHRDVKPANVLISQRGGEDHAYLTDFGVTKRTASVGGITESGSWVGTLDYVAPEQLRGGQVDGRADIYSLGCVLYEALTGQVPFPRENDLAKLWAHASDPPPSAKEVTPDVPTQLAYVAQRAMAKSPRERFETAGELGRAALAGEAAEIESHATIPLGAPVPATRARLRRLIPTAALALVGVIAAAVVLLTRDEADHGRAPPPSRTATAPLPRGDPVPPGPVIGPLSQLGGPRGCLSAGRVGGCAETRGIDGPRELAISPDGRSAYVVSRESHSVAVFARDRATGLLEQLPGEAGCLSHRLGRECGFARALGGARSVTVSGDGRNVYVAAPKSQAIAVFARNRRTGALRQLFGSAGCVRKRTGEGCMTAEGLPRPAVALVSSDGRLLYVAGAGGVAALDRRVHRRGALMPGPRAGCVAASSSTCGAASAVADARDIAEAPGGRDLYVAGGRRNRIVALRRTAAGLVGTARRPGACLSQQPGDPSCRGVRALRMPVDVVVTRDGRSLYVASRESDAIAVLRRDPASGAINQALGPAGCVSQAGANRCTEGRALDGVSALALTPDGRNLYSVSGRIHAMALLSRTSSGALRRLPAEHGCLIRFGVLGCARGRALTAAAGVTVAPDGRSVYAVSQAERIGGIALFRRLDVDG